MRRDLSLDRRIERAEQARLRGESIGLAGQPAGNEYPGRLVVAQRQQAVIQLQTRQRQRQTGEEVLQQREGILAQQPGIAHADEAEGLRQSAARHRRFLAVQQQRPVGLAQQPAAVGIVQPAQLLEPGLVQSSGGQLDVPGKGLGQAPSPRRGPAPGRHGRREGPFVATGRGSPGRWRAAAPGSGPRAAAAPSGRCGTPAPHADAR